MNKQLIATHFVKKRKYTQKHLANGMKIHFCIRKRGNCTCRHNFPFTESERVKILYSETSTACGTIFIAFAAATVGKNERLAVYAFCNRRIFFMRTNNHAIQRTEIFCSGVIGTGYYRAGDATIGLFVFHF